MKTLIINGHPNLNQSIIHKRWSEELKKYPKDFTVHNLCYEYPDYKIDVQKEQKLIENHENLILQYPIYWFNVPGLIKRWIDEVFTYGWAYGSKGDKLKDKKIALALSAGISEDDLKDNKNLNLEDLILPIKLTAAYVSSNFRGYYILYNSYYAADNGTLDKSIDEYISFIKGL